MAQETELDGSCCCCKLKTGCVIIGCLFLIEALFCIILNGMYLMIVIIANTELTPDEYYLIKSDPAIIVSSLKLLFSSLMVAFTIAMIIGVLSNKPGLVKKFLNYSVVFFISSSAYFVGFMVVYVTHSKLVIYPAIFLIFLVKFCLRGAVQIQHEAMVKSANDTSPNDACNENLEIEIYKDRSG